MSILIPISIIALFIILGVMVHRKAIKQRIPVIGEKWAFISFLKGDGSPWPSKEHSGAKPVVILDVKDGWVRYYLREFYPDERMNLESFLSMYTPTEEKTN